MNFEVLAKLPTTALLLSTSRTIVGQVRIGIVIKKSRHIYNLVMELIFVMLDLRTAVATTTTTTTTTTIEKFGPRLWSFDDFFDVVFADLLPTARRRIELKCLGSTKSTRRRPPDDDDDDGIVTPGSGRLRSSLRTSSASRVESNST